MATWKFQVTSLAAAAFAATAPLALAQVAGEPIAHSPAARASTTAAAAAINKAEMFLSQGRAAAAREVIVRAFQDDTTILPGDPLRPEAMKLLARTGEQLRRLDPADLSLQKAEVALEDGDVRTAERHIQAVLKSATKDASKADAARRLMAKVEQRRGELSAIIADALTQAERDYLAGRYEEAKSGLALVDRAGVVLSDEQQAKLDFYQLRLVEVADAHPSLFSGRANMGMMQPGTVRRREQPATPPANQPAGEPAPAPQPEPAAQPDQPAPQPAPQPEPPAVEPLPPAQPSGQQLLQQARVTEARDLLAQADRAYAANELFRARGLYTRLVNEYRDVLDPAEIQHAQDRAAQADVRAGRGQAPSPEQELQARAVARQQAQARFANFMDLASRALATGNTEEARNNAAAARLVITSARDLFSEPEHEAYQQQVSTLLGNIERDEQRIQAERARQQQLEAERRAREIEAQQRAERERRIVELIDRARAYQAEKRYNEALQAVDQLLFLDPLNPTGLLLRDLYIDIQIYTRFNDIYTRTRLGASQLSLDNREAAIPTPGLVNYPTDWPTISVRRGEPLQFAESPENRAVLADLNGRRIPSVTFQDNALQDVVQFFSTVTTLNVDVDWAALEQIGVQRDTPVSLNLTNVTGRTLLDRVVEKVSGPDRLSRADWAVQDGVIAISSKERIDRNTILVIYDVRDLLVEIPDYRDVPRIDLQQALQASQQGGGGGGQGPFQETQQDAAQQLRDREQRLDDIIAIITSNVDFEGWVENGGDVGRIQRMASQGSLIITNTAKNHRLVGGLLSKLREIRAMQINVETRFLIVNQDWFEQIGFDIDVIINADNRQVRQLRATANPNTQASDFFQDGRLRRIATTPVPGPVVGGELPSSNTGIPPARGWTPVGFTQNSMGLASGIAPQTDWSQSILGVAPALGIAGQFLDDIQVDFLIRATQADRRSIQLTAPRLTFTNGQAASIYVATQTAFVSDLEPVVGDSAVGFDPTIGVVTEGVTMLVEGTVTADRRYVTMNVDAGVARVDGFAQQGITAVAGGQLVQSDAVESFIQLPQVTVTRVRTTVTVPDQGTLLMGGQRLVTEFEVETGVPVLSKIPILNRFFTNRLESKEEQTLLILVKPTILIQNEEEERNFPGLLDSLRTGIGG
jgi:type II secretory pathway component GspD/PulD (secretin)